MNSPPLMVECPRLDPDGIACHNDAERQFVLALNTLAAESGWFAESWQDRGRVVITVDVVVPGLVVRMLRVDFDGTTLLCGPDETLQLATDLDPRRPDVHRWSGESPPELAARAAAWLASQLARPVHRREWGRGHRVEWILGDTGERLCGTGPKADGPPDSVVIVLPAGRRLGSES